MKRETISLALNSLDDRHITDTAVFSPERVQRSPERIVYMKRKRIVAFALSAALMLILGISAFAIWGIPRFTGTHQMPKTAEYTNLSHFRRLKRMLAIRLRYPNAFPTVMLSPCSV